MEEENFYLNMRREKIVNIESACCFEKSRYIMIQLMLLAFSKLFTFIVRLYLLAKFLVFSDSVVY